MIRLESNIKKNKRKIRLTDIDMSLMVEKCIRGKIFHAILQYKIAYNKYMKDEKIKNHHILSIEM